MGPGEMLLTARAYDAAMSDPATMLPLVDAAEERRLAALHALELINSAPEREFDAIVSLAAALLGTDWAAVTLIDEDRQWVKASHGNLQIEEPRELSICQYTIQADEVMVVPDAEADPRLEPRRVAYGRHDIRFYAGAPIHAPTGERIGALCVADPKPRRLDMPGDERLRELAILVDALIAARSTAREAIRVAEESALQAEHLQRQERIMQQAQRLAMIGSWRLTLEDEGLGWSDNVYRIYGVPVGERMTVDRALDFYPPKARGMISEALARLIETGAIMDVEVDFITAQGVRRRVRSMAELELSGGQPVAIVGVFQDVTERWTMEQALRRSADQDELTGIANRAAFNRTIEKAIAAFADGGGTLMLALVDLDGFKAVNDSLGHLAGDDVLKAVGRRLSASWLAGSFAARLGGDEFALIVTDNGLTRDPEEFARRLEADLKLPVTGVSGPIPSAGTVGTAMLREGDTVRDLVHRADETLYAAKRARQGERRRGERRGERRAV
jgi:diguanylate cyclase (GGDEF)-like protein